MAIKNILVLSYVHEGGEWFATERLIGRVKKQSAAFRFFLVGLSNGYEANSNCFDKIVYVRGQTPKPPLSFFKKIIFDVLAIRQSVKRLSDEINHVDAILVAHYLMVFPIFFIKKIPKKPILFFFHGTKTDPTKFLSDFNYRIIVPKIMERLALVLSSSIVVPSSFAENFVRSLIFPFDKIKNFYTVPNCISDEFYQPVSEKTLKKIEQKLKIPAKSKVILYSGRIVKYKGLENLTDAFIKFQRHQKDTYLVFTYPERSSDLSLLNLIKTKIEKGNLKSKVLFLQNLKKEDLIKIYRVSNVLVLASELEMAPLVIIESLACGTPVIASRVGNAEELLSLVDPHLILQKGSKNEILLKIKYFFSLPESKIKHLKRAAVEVASVYSKLNPAKKFIQILDSSVR